MCLIQSLMILSCRLSQYHNKIEQQIHLAVHKCPNREQQYRFAVHKTADCEQQFIYVVRF